MNANPKEALVKRFLEDNKTYDFISKKVGVSNRYIKQIKDKYNIVNRGRNSGNKHPIIPAKPTSKKEDEDFLVRLIIRCTHRRTISQTESERALKIIKNF